MKLFQQLLIAPAALGLLAPVSAIASEVNLDAISNYSEENLELDIKTLDTNDPDELDIETLDIKADNSLTDLDIIELK